MYIVSAAARFMSAFRLISQSLVSLFFLMGSAGAAPLLRDAEIRDDRYVDAPVVHRLPAGTEVQVVRIEGGWALIRAGGKSGWVRAGLLGGEGAARASVASLESGRTAPGNVVATTGIRGLPTANRHALIILADSVPDRPERATDESAALEMAAVLATPQENTTVSIVGRDDEETIRSALHSLARRVQRGDRVFTYLNVSVTADRDCVLRPARRESQSKDDPWWSAAALTQVTDRLDKWLVIWDPIAADDEARRCLDDPGQKGGAVRGLLARGGAPAGNVTEVISRSSATGRWRDCLLGEALDLDGSGAVNVAEISRCASPVEQSADASLAWVVGGNERYVPIPRREHLSLSEAVQTSSKGMTRTLEQVFAQRDTTHPVEISLARASLRIGQDELDLSLRSSRGGFVYLLLLGSDDRSVYLLFPNRIDQANRIEPDTSMRLPRSDWRIASSGPAGRNRLLAVVTDSPRDHAAAGMVEEGAFLRTSTDGAGRGQMHWLLGRSRDPASVVCTTAGQTRTLTTVLGCSDAFGAALVDVWETD